MKMNPFKIHLAQITVLFALLLPAYTQGSRPSRQTPSNQATPTATNPLDNSGPRILPAEDTAPIKFTSRVESVLVPVIVQDKSRKHVSGLSKNDFVVQENGKDQPIVSVEEVRADVKPPKRTLNRGATYSNRISGADTQKQLTIIAFDLVNTSFKDQAHARQGLVDYLSKIGDDQSLYQVVVISSKGLRLLHDFTNDHQQLVAVIKALKSEVTGERTTDQSRQEVTNVAPADVPGFLMNLEPSQLEYYLSFLFAEDVAYQQADAINTTLSAFQAIAQRVSGVPGRKSLIWVTAGFPFSLEDNNAYLENGQPLLLYERTVQALTAANIAVYPVDARGLTYAGLPDASVRGSRANFANPGDLVAQSYRQHSSTIGTMEQFAEGTGGKAYYNRNDVDQSIAEANNESASYYMLTYALNKKDTRPGWRKLNVKVLREGLKARSRKGFFVTRTTMDPNNSRSFDIQQALGSPLEYTGLPATVTWKAIDGNGPNRKVTFELNLGANAALVDATDSNHMVVDFAVIANDPQGKEAAQVSRTYDFKLKPDAVDQVKNSGITYTNTIEVPLGDYTVHFVVRDNLTGKIGSLVVPLKVT